MKKTVALTLDEDVLDVLDKDRGLTKRSPLVNSILRKHYNMNKEVNHGKE